MNERDKILNQNSQCQHKIAEHFRKKKGADERQEVEKSVTDQEQRSIFTLNDENSYFYFKIAVGDFTIVIELNGNIVCD